MTKIYFWSVWRSQFILFLDGCLRCPFVLFFLSNWIQMFPLPANEAFPSLCCRCIVRSPKCEASFKRGGVANTLFRGASLLTRCLCRFHKRQEYSRCDLSEKGDWLSDAPDARPSSYPWLSRSSQVVSLSSAAARSGSPTDMNLDVIPRSKWVGTIARRQAAKWGCLIDYTRARG